MTTSWKIFTRTTGIYKITNKLTSKVYVGLSKDIASRWKIHLSMLNKGKHHCKSLQEEYIKLEDYTFEILEICKKKELSEKEIYWWDKIKAEGTELYNGRPTGARFPEPTKETKRKQSAWQIGKPKSEETRKKIKLNAPSKKVLQYTKEGILVAEYDSHKDAARALNISNSNISKVCRGERKTCGGFVWRNK